VSDDRAAVLREAGEVVAIAIATARDMSDADCRRTSSAESWPAVIVAYHIGLGLRRQAGFIARALTGEEPFEFQWEPTHDMNAVNAREHASMSKDEAADEIEAGWTRLQNVIARMAEEDWSRDVFTFAGHSRSADVVLRRIVLPHVTEHLTSLRTTVAAG
jgi:DinB family protein